MEDMKLLLDSVILIDHFNDFPPATDYLFEYRDESLISVITRAEVLCGFSSAERVAPQRFLDFFTTLPLTVDDADLAATLRREMRLKLADAFQAAVAQNHGCRLVTRNNKDFPPEKYSFVKMPYEWP